jgi:hypothetical protein
MEYWWKTHRCAIGRRLTAVYVMHAGAYPELRADQRLTGQGHPLVTGIKRSDYLTGELRGLELHAPSHLLRSFGHIGGHFVCNPC